MDQDRAFPTLADALIARITPHAQRRGNAARQRRWRDHRARPRPGRCGNIKRVASAVGEGSIAVAFVHQVLQVS